VPFDDAFYALDTTFFFAQWNLYLRKGDCKSMALHGKAHQDVKLIPGAIAANQGSVIGDRTEV
jgi:hypothetical protein